jgi:hypothetical protein
VCIRYGGNVSTGPLRSKDKGIFTEPLRINDRGIFTEEVTIEVWEEGAEDERVELTED